MYEKIYYFLLSSKLGDGLVGLDEYRLDCVSRAAFNSIKEIDDAYNKLLSVSLVSSLVTFIYLCF